MGIIKEGKIRGNLPSEEAFAVHYPAYPSSIERAIQTLGGIQTIAKARSSELNKLELHFRPEDPYSHPAFGELRPCNNFLLRISKHKVSDAQNSELRDRVSRRCSSADAATLGLQNSSSELEKSAQQASQPETENVANWTGMEAQVPEEAEQNLFADIVTRIPEAYQFNGMADYQHILAVHADVARRKKRNWAEFEKGGLMDVDQEDLMILLPPLFSLKDMPADVVLKPSFNISSRKKQEGVVHDRWEGEIEPSLALDFNIKEVPKQVNWEKHIPEGSEQWEWQKAVCDLFEERPIWVKDSLSERLLDKGLEFGGNMLRRLLFRAAYYFSSGPFLRFWIRKGYDPRKDPESRIYQRTDFRVPPSLRSYSDNNVASGSKHRWEDICAFRVFPHKFQTSLQLFELADDYIQDEIRKPPTRATCSRTTGWFSSHMLDTFRLCVAVRFLSVYPKAGAESFRKSASSRFEKSKRMCMFPEDLKLNEEGEQANREEIEVQDNEPNNDEDDEEDEIDDGNIEEDLEAYEELDLAGQEGNFSPEADMYTDHENISKHYLQDLFGSFPFNEATEDEPQDANGSDGEYQIFEQYSDGNYSDDDDY